MTIASGATAPTSFDPFASERFADLHRLLERARRETPVLYSDELGMWVVTRYDDALAVLRDPVAFSSSTRAVLLSQFEDEARAVLERTRTFAAPNMGFDGQPDHERLRSPVSRFFSARGVAAREPRLRALAASHLDALAPGDGVDLMGAYARPLAEAVILDLAGLPQEDRALVMHYHEATNAFFFGAPSPDEQLRYAHDVVAWEAYLAEAVERRRHDPGDDLTSHVLAAMAAGEADYTPGELVGLLSFDVVTAGVRPIAFAVANLCRQLLEDRARWEALVADPSRFDRCFDESLRRRGLSLGVYRQATRDVEVAGVTIPAGGVVWVMVCSTSHDESRYPDSHAFDPDREGLAGSLHFSHGLHYCLGASLARQATRAAVGELVARHPTLRLTPGQVVDYEPSFNLMVPTRLLVDVDPGAATPSRGAAMT